METIILLICFVILPAVFISGCIITIISENQLKKKYKGFFYNLDKYKEILADKLQHQENIKKIKKQIADYNKKHPCLSSCGYCKQSKNCYFRRRSGELKKELKEQETYYKTYCTLDEMQFDLLQGYIKKTKNKKLKKYLS